MADIYGRQGQCAELFELWDKPPASLKGLMKKHGEDILGIKTRLLRQQENWELLEQHCLASINETLSYLNLAQDSKCLWELCAWRRDVWDALMDAIANTRPGPE